jgi:hypothetical protein
VQQSRIGKTQRFFRDRIGFLHDLHKAIGTTIRLAARRDMKPVIRLNGTSDLPWERLAYAGKTMMEWFPETQFYDYTKSPKRMEAFLSGEMPTNYHLTFSRSESNHQIAMSILRSGGNVAAVLRMKRHEEMPQFVRNLPVIDGDQHDLRFLDPSPVIVGLRAKGDSIKDTSGFVMDAVA